MALWLSQVGILKNEEIQNMSGILLLSWKTQSASLWREAQVRKLSARRWEQPLDSILQENLESQSYNCKN